MPIEEEDTTTTTTTTTTNEDGPKYKISSFLFGNVNKEGQIEEYQHDDELKSINNLDRCHVREVEETATHVLSDNNNNNPIPSVQSDDGSNQLLATSNSMDYYNEQEVIAEELVENVLHTMKPEKIKEDDYDSYDDTELGASQTQKGESDPTSLPTEERQISPEENTTVQLSSTEPSSPNHQIDLIEANHEQTTGEEILESSSPTLLSSLPTEMISPYKLMSYADISVSEDATLIMPPPLHPAPLSVSRANQVKPVYSRNLDSPICSPIPVTYPHSECTRSPSYSPSSIQNHDNNHDNGLNTPLGSLMPVEYANVDIKELFPSYDPGKIPLWGRLFRLPHPLGIYHEYIERYEYMEEMLSHRLSRSDRQHLIYDGILDLGEIPLPEDIISSDEVVELNTPPTPGLDYLAGSETSWWRRAFKAALEELMNPKNEKTEQDDNYNNKNKKEIQEQHRHRQHHQQLYLDDSYNKNHEISDSDYNVADSYIGWRLGPAKYWYDQLGLPLDINISEWTEWRRPLPSTLNCNNNSHNSSSILSVPPSSSSSPPRPPSPSSSSSSSSPSVTMTSPTATADEPADSADNDKNNSIDMNKSVSDSNCPAMKKENNNDDDDDDNTTPTTTTTAATTTSLPNKNFSVHECHKQDPDDCQQRSTNESLALSSPPTPRKNNSRTLLSEDIHQPSHFYPYQLLNWEDDIIYDPQLSAAKISNYSRLNAAYAGWIPSQHCRTMSAFQDAYQGKFPFILNSKTINGITSSSSSASLTTTLIMESLLSHRYHADKHSTSTKNTIQSNPPPPPPPPPYSIFPVENQAILKDAWIHDIIYDCDLPADQQPPPFLLTLDQNDETCILEPINDASIATTLSIIRSQRQKRLMSSRGLEGEVDKTTGDMSTTGNINIGSANNNINNTTTTNNNSIRGNIQDASWSNSNQMNDTSDNKLNSSNMATVNRTSLQVNFGLASTRGMFTGALAKAEKGAEKVKMILGKHGLLAEDDWQPNQSEKLMTTDNDRGAVDQLQEANEFNSDSGNAALASAAAAVSGIPPKDPLNLSNDEYYAIRSGALALGGLARCGPLQHSTPAVELWPPFFPTFMSPLRLRQFHRVPLKRYLRGPMSQFSVPFPVTNLTRHIHRKMREREDERAATGGGEIFFMRNPGDLSGADGEIVLFEFSEEYPPLMAQVGMATRIINYYRPLVPRDRSLSPCPHAYNEPPELPYGSLVYVGGSDSPFLGVIRPGGCLQTVENSMYRAPIYPHTLSNTDFLLIRNRNGISIRRIANAFTVGQEVPLMEVPGPNSKRANNFVRDFLQVFILRLFLRSTDEPKRIKMEEIRKAFPNHSESSVRKRLKICADFKRTGSDASWWVLRSDYRLPSEEEVRYLVSPEDCCAHYSMLAAELRLKDAGYGEKCLFVLDENQGEEEEDKEGQPKMEDEVRAAPWNTTRAYLASQRGGCFLELHGAADPTGCGEAFSYSKTSAKPGALFRQAGGEVARGLLKGKRTVTGTDADLRKLHLRDARALLRSFGISEADLKTFKRWEIIDMVRFTSTERAKQGEEEGSAKFARGNRLSMSEQIRCYKEECQRIFDLQNRVLSNPELLSSDEEMSSEDDEDEVTGADGVGHRSTGLGGHSSSGPSNSIGGVRLSSLSSSARSYAQVSRNMESLMSNRMTSKELDSKGDDKDRSKLKRALEGSDSLPGTKRPRKTNQLQLKEADISSTECNEGSTTGNTVYEASATAAGTILDLQPPWPNANKKMLRIMRTYSEDGHQYTRTELVPWSPVVEIYLKIRQTRDDEFIHNFVDSDDHFREQQKKEKRRLQDQLRRLRKQQQIIRERGGGGVGSGGAMSGMKSSLGLGNKANRHRRHKTLTEALIKMRCGACGQMGHMRTNKECPMYGRGGGNPSASLQNDAGVRRTTATPTTTERGHLRSQTSLRNLSRSFDDLGNSKLDDRGELSFLEANCYTGRKLEPETIAAAQALASRPVCELLAEQEEEEEQEAKGHHGHGTDSLDDRHHSKDSDDFDESSMHSALGENDMTVEGTKLKLHSGLTKYIKEQNRRNLKLKIRRQLLDRLDAAAAVVQSAVNSSRRGAMGGGRGGGAGGRNRRSSMGINDDDFPTSIKHRGNRRRIDPRVALNHIFEGIYKGLTQIPGYKIFMHPVKEKDFPNYYSQIDTPMDLSQIRMKINENSYATREEFLSDIRLIYNNSSKFNGRYSAYTETAMKMCSHVMEQFCHKELKLMRLESLVNPLLDEDDLVGLSYLLQQAIEAMRSVEHSRPFHIPVDKRRYPDYYKIISNPMDLSTLEKLVKENRFHSREEFFERTELILSNCITFNGTESPLTEIAQKMLQAARTRLEQDKETLDTLEANIRSSHLGNESQSCPNDSNSLLLEDEHHHQQQQQKAVSSSSKSKLLKRRLSPLKSASKEEKQEGGGEPGEVKKKLHGLIIEKGDTSPHHHRHHDVSFTSSDDQATITPEKSMTNKPVDNNSGGNTGGCGRLLRQRSSGAWYGVDLEYDDDDDDESDEDGSARSDDDDKYTHKPSSSTKRIPITGSRSGTSKQWMTTEIDDDESNELLYTSKSNQSTSKLQDSEHTEDSNYTEEGGGGGGNVLDENSSFYDWNSQEAISRTIVDADNTVRQSGHNLSEASSPTSGHTVEEEEEDEEEEGEDNIDQHENDNRSNHAYDDNYDDDSQQINDWNQFTRRSNVEDGDGDDGDVYHGGVLDFRSQQDKFPTYIDEDTRFSVGNSEMPGSITGVGVAGVSTVSGHLDYSQLDLNDDLVAKDLQLTDSDDDSCLSGQGGELCTDENDVVGLNLVGNEEDVDDRGDGDGVEGVHTPDDYTGYNLSNYQVMPQNDSLSYDQHCQQEHQQQQHQHQSDDNNPVSFFISDEDDDDS